MKTYRKPVKNRVVIDVAFCYNFERAPENDLLDTVGHKAGTLKTI